MKSDNTIIHNLFMQALVSKEMRDKARKAFWAMLVERLAKGNITFIEAVYIEELFERGEEEIFGTPQ